MGVVAKTRHTIIDEWPMRLKKQPREEGAKEEFIQRLGSGHTGMARYMEWQRIY